jgi:hypothetical protein
MTTIRGFPEANAYRSARYRCSNKRSKDWKSYGGRGIEFRFTSLVQFIAVVGRRPSPYHSLDRKDNNGHYEPGNVRWATATQQIRNRRKRKTLRKV